MFFGPKRLSHDLGWASLEVVAWPDPPFDNPDAPSAIKLFFYAFGWASDPGIGPPPQCTVHRVREMESPILRMLNNTAEKHSHNAYLVANQLLKNGVSEQHFLVAGRTEREVLLLVYHISCVENANKCLNPFWKVNFSWRVIPGDEVPEPSSRNWTGIT